ncbi:hypothetical protein COMA1_60009 [Candidatus Nitrospira nitrosa]|uniref:Uncharacterized protein n=1 Tax=Candidatus Nitrospira nitrosa TaxID=1742972 RepID=A0A0S4LM68_9BACT|nr:hypothetical protein COMA1_60009 [Candidatus Nitrospira nitrosa]
MRSLDGHCTVIRERKCDYYPRRWQDPSNGGVAVIWLVSSGMGQWAMGSPLCSKKCKGKTGTSASGSEAGTVNKALHPYETVLMRTEVELRSWV